MGGAGGGRKGGVTLLLTAVVCVGFPLVADGDFLDSLFGLFSLVCR